MSDESDIRLLRAVIRSINERWHAGDYDAIGRVVSDDAVIAPPHFGGRVRGRDAYVRSYIEYDQAVQTHEYLIGEPQIDIVEDSAVAVTPFRVVYEHGGEVYREHGREILVFGRAGGGWKVAWRTMLSDEAEPDDDWAEAPTSKRALTRLWDEGPTDT